MRRLRTGTKYECFYPATSPGGCAAVCPASVGNVYPASSSDHAFQDAPVRSGKIPAQSHGDTGVWLRAICAFARNISSRFIWVDQRIVYHRSRQNGPDFFKRERLYISTFSCARYCSASSSASLVQQGASHGSRNGPPAADGRGARAESPSASVGAAQRFCGRGHPADPAYLPGGQLRIAVDILSSPGPHSAWPGFRAVWHLLEQLAVFSVGAALCSWSKPQGPSPTHRSDPVQKRAG